MNGSDPSGMCSGFLSCISAAGSWVGHQVQHHWRGIATTVALTAAVASMVLTAGADTPAIAAYFAVSEGLDAASVAAGADVFLTSGSSILSGYAGIAGYVSLGAGGLTAFGDCLHSRNAQCALDIAMLGLGGIGMAIKGLGGALIGLGSSLPWNTASVSGSANLASYCSKSS